MAEKEPPVLIERDGAVAIITLNRPAERNPVTGPGMTDALLAALAQVNDDRSVHCAILTAAGSVFSAGGDVKAMGAALELRRTEPARTPASYRRGVQRLPLAFQELEVPIIAAVNGPAVGAGCDVTCMCDIRIASEKATFAESFVRMGLVAGDGGAWLLQRTVGFSKACEMAFTAESIDAAEALRIGLVSQVVPHDELMPAARALAARIAKNPPDAVRMTKRLMVQARDQHLAAALEAARALQALAHTTPEHKAAVEAFNKKKA